jgi:hypothetical protein
MKKNISLISTALIAFIITGCAKIPDKCMKPTVEIAAKEEGDGNIYLLQFTSKILNENSDVALQDVTGYIYFKKNEKDDKPVFTIPFEIPIILPFGDGNIIEQREYPLEEIAPLVDLLGGDTEKLAIDRGMESTNVYPNNIELKIESYKKKDILDLLKDKV